MGASIDYVAMTFKGPAVQDILGLLAPYVPTWAETRGHHGYKECWRSDGFAIYYDGQAGMGIHVQVSGAGCAVLSNSVEFPGWGPLVSSWLAEGAAATRIDLAYDDMSGSCTMDRMLSHIEGGHYTSRWQSRSQRQSVASGQRTANVLYMGSATSDTCLCVYDKQLETVGRDLPDPGPWLRAELRFKRDQAVTLANWIIEHPGFEGVEGLLGGAIDFKELSNDKNKTRVNTCAWWKEFLHHASKLRISPIKAVRTVAQRAVEFIRQQGPTLAMLATCVDAGSSAGEFVAEVVRSGMARLRDKHLNVISQALTGASLQPG